MHLVTDNYLNFREREHVSGLCHLITIFLLIHKVMWHELTAVLQWKPILYCFFLTECNRPLGLQDGRILNSQLSSSSHFEHLIIGNGKNANLKAEFARLNNSLAWCSPSRRNSHSTFIEINLNQEVNISGIATQGFRGINAYYVKKFKVAYSKDRVAWKFLKKVTQYWQYLINLISKQLCWSHSCTFMLTVKPVVKAIHLPGIILGYVFFTTLP